MFKKTITALVVTAVAALSGCGTVPLDKVPLGNTGTATIRVEFPEYNANVTTSNGASCNSPCSFNYRVDLSKDVLVSDNVTYTWPSGATYVLRINVTRSDVNQLGTAISFVLSPNINTAERLTTNRAPAAQQPQAAAPQSEGSVLELLGIFAGAYNDAAAERKRNAPVNCTTMLMGTIANTTCR